MGIPHTFAPRVMPNNFAFDGVPPNLTSMESYGPSAKVVHSPKSKFLTNKYAIEFTNFGTPSHALHGHGLHKDLPGGNSHVGTR
jgi:hypothetical protein